MHMCMLLQNVTCTKFRLHAHDIDDKIHAQNVGLYFVYMMEQQHGAFYGLNDIDNDAIHRSDSNSYNSLNCLRVEKIGCVL